MTADSDGQLDEAKAIELAKSLPVSKAWIWRKSADKRVLPGRKAHGNWWVQKWAQLVVALKNWALTSSKNLTSWRMTLASKPTSCVCSLTAAVMSPLCLPKRLSMKCSNITQTVFSSNGPGDPEPVLMPLMPSNTSSPKPIFRCLGFCLGHQLLALASGAQTPKWNLVTMVPTTYYKISSNRYGDDYLHKITVLRWMKYACQTIKVTHRSLFDGSNQGIELTNKNTCLVFWTSRASPGPPWLCAIVW